ncbi:hypothetical protein [Leptolyngbya sp. PCC 6406]|uniref:hypothetical protein n=1 Tax=Leptolyngbya sp. PCC 6406 TaxID=1173264 RepID=UPI0002ABDEC1|nr:hypothetical protein [Leptolyngbya sp. PCC 6406]
MDIRWRTAWRYPQTLFLLVGTGLGYGAFLVIAGFNPLALLLGSAIAGVMLIAWFLQFRKAQLAEAGTLLDADTMAAHLAEIRDRVPLPSPCPEWHQAQNWAMASQAAAAQIAQADPPLSSDLLETLYTVEALARQIAGSAAARQQVQTAQYQDLTQQHLQASSDRLQETHDQLQKLRDQILLSQLTTEAAADTSLPARLQLLIDANKTTLNAANDDRS